MYGYIYKYTNRINGKVYIGQTKKTPQQRAGKEGKNYHHKFGNAIKKYGWENFELEILEHIDLEEKELTTKLNELETYYIRFYDSVANGYNLCPEGNASKGWSEAMRKHLSNTIKGRVVSEETRRKISVAKKGHKPATLTPELSKKLSEAGKKSAANRMGKHYYTNGQIEIMCFEEDVPEGWVKGRKPVSEITRKKLSEANKGKKLSQESIDKRTQTRLLKNNGNYMSDEGKESIKNYQSNKKLSPETIEKRTKTRKEKGWYIKDRN